MKKGKLILDLLNTTAANEIEMKPKMNMEWLFMIFKHLELSDLVNMAEVNAVFYYVALYEFKRKYSHQMFSHSELKGAPKPKSLIEKVLHDGTEEFVFPAYDNVEVIQTKKFQFIKLNDYQLLLKTIKYFGCLLKRFNSNEVRLDKNAVKVIFQHLNKYSSQSLIRLAIHFADVELLTELKGPFPNVTEFKFTANSERVFDFNPKSLIITKKFPNLRRFSFFNGVGVRDTVFPNEHFPHLEYVRIEYRDGSEKRSRISKFLFQNPHIQHLKVVGFPGDYIMKIHSILPNLEKLTFGADIPNSSIDIKKPIHFEHLKSLHVHCSHVRGMRYISFSNLEELQIHYSPVLFHHWNGFFRNNHNFTRLIIKFVSEFYTQCEDQISLHLNGLPSNIVEITIMEEWYFLTKETIVSILQSRPNLMKLTYIAKRDIQHLKDEIQTDWNIRSLVNLDREIGLEFTR